MAETKKLVVVVEGTAALGLHWRTIVSGYLEKVIRSFCGDEDSTTHSPAVQLALVKFNVRGPYSSCLAQRSGWTKSMDMFLEWLSAIYFIGGGFCDAAIAEGLAEALMMFPSANGSQNHCILVAASNPYPLPTPVYIPPNCIKIQSDGPFSNAETVAKYFKQCLVSLSVICPRQLPKLKAIYNAAKRNPSGTDPTIDTVKNPNYLVLISENFMEARAALSQPEITNLPSNQSPTVIESPVNRQPVSSGNIPHETIKEPSTGSSMASAQTYSSSSTYQEMTSMDDNAQNSNHVVSATITKPPMLGITAILNKSSQSRLVGPENPNLSIGGMASFGQAESATSTGTSTTNVVNYNVAINVGPPLQTSSALQSEPSRYVKLWEGNLTVERQGQHVFITKLQGYRNRNASESLAKDWPTTMQINRLIPEDEMKNQKYNGKVDYLVFRALNEHSMFLGRMQEKKLSMVIKLASQTLVLCVSADKASRLVGMVLPQEMVKYKVMLEGKCS